MATDDFLAHPVGEFISPFGDGPTGYMGQTFVADASNLTRIEFELDPILGWGDGPTNYNVLVASVILNSAGNFVRPDELLFESAPRTFNVDGVQLNWQRVSVDVSGLDLVAGQTYVFLLNANFDGNAARGAANVAGIGVDEDVANEPEGNAVFLNANTGSIESDFAFSGLVGWFNVQGDLAYRLTYADTPPPGIINTGTNKDDNLVGDAGDDELSGGNGADTIRGLGGNDKLKGQNGNDNLFGGTGNDDLDGGNGNDSLNGGAGNNRLTGGNGADGFHFDDSATGTNIVTDFKVGMDHLVFEDGVEVIDIDDNPGGVTLTLNTIGGEVTLLGVHVDELQPLM